MNQIDKAISDLKAYYEEKYKKMDMEQTYALFNAIAYLIELKERLK